MVCSPAILSCNSARRRRARSILPADKAEAQAKGGDVVHDLLELVSLLGGLQMEQFGAELTV